jgi:hypothetical protein
VTITTGGFIEFHISTYVGFLASEASISSWYKVSLHNTIPHRNSRCQAFSDWLDRMYNPKTGTVFNGGQFEKFKLGRKSKYSGN